MQTVSPDLMRPSNAALCACTAAAAALSDKKPSTATTNGRTECTVTTLPRAVCTGSPTFALVIASPIQPPIGTGRSLFMASW